MPLSRLGRSRTTCTSAEVKSSATARSREGCGLRGAHSQPGLLPEVATFQLHPSARGCAPWEMQVPIAGRAFPWREFQTPS